MPPKLAAAAAVATFAAAPAVQAVAIFDDLGQITNRVRNTTVVGTEFQVGGSDVMISALGAWESGSDGFLTSHDVGIWDVNQTLIPSATVPAGTAGFLDDAYLYVALPANVTLAANATYRISAVYTTIVGAIDPFNDQLNTGSTDTGPRIAANPGIAALTGAFFSTSATLAYPATASNNPPVPARWSGGNAQFAVPEPTSLALVGLGGVALLGRRQRKQAR